VRSEFGFSHLWQPGNDLLLLRPQTEVTAGFLEEMQSVLHLHERHAVVAPRTNGPSFLAFPPEDDVPASESYRLWQKLHDTLPRYYIAPAISNFCLLIKSEVLGRFGLSDLAFLVDVENEFIRRINRFGYTTLAANWAYVFNAEVEPAPVDTLAERYPELERKISDFRTFQIDPIETFAILESPHRPRILYDLYHLPPQHSGTSDFALNLLRDLEPLASQEIDIYVGAGEDQAFFLTDLCGYRLHDEKSSLPMLFDLVYKPCQIFRWPEFARMNRLAPRIAFTLLDIIALRCDYIGNSSLPPIFQKSVELSDLVFTISESSRSDFAAFYSTDGSMPVISLASHARLFGGEETHGEHILIMGNALTHKGVPEAVRCLGDDFPLVVVGVETKSDRANVRWLASGQLSRRFMDDLFRDARIVVYPSYYEGYGLPVADALASGKPVIVLDTAINREMASITGAPHMHRISSLNELQSAVRRLWAEPPSPTHSSPRRWPEAAAEYLAAFRELLSKDIDLAKMRRRWETIRLIESLGSS
jgi:glycosyltransferase involved in cell wall biosynthesis